MTISISEDITPPFGRSTRAASTAKRLGGTVLEREGVSGIHESWVRPDGTIERNIKMDLVVSAAKKRLRCP